jgi:FAD/FMN-containing dehydrogenase
MSHVPLLPFFPTNREQCSRVFTTNIDVVSPVTLATTGALYWSAQAAALTPGCVVHPKETSEVATVVETLTKSNCTFAVRGGGHTFWAGSASIGSEGVVISLDYINHINISTNTSTVQIGGGATWNRVYNTLDPANLAVPGGRVVDVGVGGLTLGGK